MKSFIKVLSVILLFSSCTDELVYTNYSDINPEIFPVTEEDASLLVNACYRAFRTNYSGSLHATGTPRGVVFFDAMTEILSYGSWSIHDLRSTDASLTRFYDEFYNQISLMTVSIDQIENMDISETTKANAIAEIRCLRGYLSYVLFDLFGPIVIAPLEVLKDPLIETPLARLSYDEMVSYIESDLSFAAENLVDPEEAEYGRVNSALARMILIRLYLHEKQWSKVEEVCDELINLNYYSIDDDYLGMWDLEGAKNSNEVIWAIPCDYEGRNFNEWHYASLPPNYPGHSGFNSAISTWWFYDTFEEEDVRKTRLIAEYTGTDGVLYSREAPGPYLIQGPRPLKMVVDENRPGGSSTVDWILYRYADVLISKAEAIAMQNGGPNQEVLNLVNIIRNRAGLEDASLSDFSDLDAFIDFLLTERSHEFWCENGQYRADLIRHGKFIDRCREVTGSTFTDENKVLLPFSEARVSEGKGVFIQNPGYF